MSAALRASALSLTPEQVGFVPAASGPNIFGVLMETGYEKAVSTLACFCDGSTSLYFSTGGGVIGCGEHESVKSAAKMFVSIANKYTVREATSSENPLPGIGMVRFYLRTPTGRASVQVPEKDLAEKGSQLWPLFFAGHAVIAAIRKLGLM